MHRNLAGALALALVVAFGAVTARAEGGINWVSDLDAAKKQAAEQKRLILVNFWAEW